MTFPVIAASATTADTTSTSITVEMPTGIVAGNLLIVIVAQDAVGTITQSGGSDWTKIEQINHSTSAASYALFAKIAAGGDTLTLTSTNSQDAACVSLRITGHGVSNISTDIKKGTASSTLTSASPDPPNCTQGTVQDNLWIELFAADDDDDTATYQSTNYTQVAQIQSASSTSSCLCAVASRNLNASAEDPGVMAMALSEEWIAQTLAIPPSSSSQVTQTWNLRHDLSSAITQTWNLRHDLSSVITQTWNLRHDLSSAITQTWNLRHDLSSMIEQIWNLRHDLASQITQTWNLRHDLSSMIEQIWNLRHDLLSGTQITQTWTLRHDLSNMVEQVWNLRHDLSSMIEQVWNLRHDLSSSIEQIWNLRHDLASQITQTWNLRHDLASQISQTWNLRHDLSSMIEQVWTLRHDLSSMIEQIWNLRHDLLKYKITGITYLGNGISTILGSVVCRLHKDNLNGTSTFISETTSNPTTGVYIFRYLNNNDAQYYITGWKDNAEHIYDMTDHNIQPVDDN